MILDLFVLRNEGSKSDNLPVLKSPKLYFLFHELCRCTLCDKVVQIWDASTTNMKVHLEKQHAETIIEVRNLEIQSVSRKFKLKFKEH